MVLSIKKIKLYAPLIFWTFQLIIHIIRSIYLLFNNPFSSIFNNIIFTFPLDITTFCVFYYFLAPKYIKKEKLRLYVSLGIIYFFLHACTWTYVYYLRGIPKEELLGIYISSIGHTMLYTFYAIIIQLAIDWFQKREDKKELEKQNIKTELALLRSQINPHFLFNTLNNIHSYAISDPDKSSYATIKLSKIMRYMLYETKDDKVMLEKEINYINNYLDLQKIRYKHKNFVKFEVINTKETILIPPMLFIPFIENAFKHGKKSGKDQISIKIEQVTNELHFFCNNQKKELNETEKINDSGIGIENIKRRLTLIYPEKHKLEIIENGEMYTVKLMIDIEN